MQKQAMVAKQQEFAAKTQQILDDFLKVIDVLTTLLQSVDPIAHRSNSFHPSWKSWSMWSSRLVHAQSSFLPSICLPLQKKDLMEQMQALADRRSSLNEKEDTWRHQMEEAKKNAERTSERIVLDIGGTLFHTTKATLTDEHDTYFYGMLRSGEFRPDSQGSCPFKLKG